MEMVRVARSAEEGKEVRPYISYHYKLPAWDTGSLPSIDSQENIVDENHESAQAGNDHICRVSDSANRLFHHLEIKIYPQSEENDGLNRRVRVRQEYSKTGMVRQTSVCYNEISLELE